MHTPMCIKKLGIWLSLLLLAAIAITTLTGCEEEDPAAQLAQMGGGSGSTSRADRDDDSSPPRGMQAAGEAEPGEEEVVELGYTGPRVLTKIAEIDGMYPDQTDSGHYDIRIFFIADLPDNEVVIPDEYLKEYGLLDPGEEVAEAAAAEIEEQAEELADVAEVEAEVAEPAEGEGEAVDEEEEEAVDPIVYVERNVWEFLFFDINGEVVATDLKETTIPTSLQRSMVWKHFYCSARPVLVELRLTELEATTADGAAEAGGGEDQGLRGGSTAGGSVGGSGTGVGVN